MGLTLEIYAEGHAHFARTVCTECSKNVLITYTIPFRCSRCGHVMNANIVFLHTRAKFRHKFHNEGRYA